jgi:hypothetical protein
MFKAVFILEEQKLFTGRNIKLFLPIFILLGLFCWDGITDFNTINENRKPFQEMERDKVSMHIHYTFYGIRGVRLLLIPSPISVLFNDTALFDGATAHVDTAEKLNISNSFKGKGLFSNSGGYMDFSGIIFLIGSFLALLYGYDAIRNQKYLKFVSQKFDSRNPTFFILLSRVILLNLVFLIMACLPPLFQTIYGMNAFNIFYLVFILGLFLIVTFFISTGAAIASIKNKPARLIALPIVYFLLVLFIPWAVKKAVYIAAKESIESIYKFEYKTFKYVMDFEKRFYKQFGVWKSGDVAPNDIQEFIESGQDREFNKLRKLEIERIDSILKKIRIYHTIAALFPTSFYLSMNKELSSKGFLNLIAFYRYAYEMKFKFIRFYIERKFYRPLPKSGVEPFIKKNEDLFYSQSRLPGSYFIGIILTSFYIAVLSFFTYKGVKKLLEGEPGDLRALDINIKPGRLNFLLTGNGGLKNQVYNFLRGKGKSFVNIAINGEEIEPGGISFVILFDTKELPDDITAWALYKFLFGKKMETPMEKGDILFSWSLLYAGEDKIIVMDEFMDRLKEAEIKKMKKVIHSEKLRVLYISDKYYKGVHLITDELIIEHPKDKPVDKPKKQP